MSIPPAVGKVRLALARVAKGIKGIAIVGLLCAFTLVPWRFSNPIVSSFTVSFLEDMTYTFTPDEFDAVFSDTVDNALEGVVVYGLPQNGVLSLSGVDVSVGDTIAHAAINAFSYVPQANFTGHDTLTWFGVTQTGQNTDTVFLHLEVKPANDIPTLNSLVYFITEDNPLYLPWSTLDGQVFDDIDDGDQLHSLQITQFPTHGSLYILSEGISNAINALDSTYLLGSSDSIAFYPELNYNGSDSWRWTMSDGQAFALADAGISLTIFAEEDPATVSDLNLEVGIDSALSISSVSLFASYSDPEGDSLVEMEVKTLPSFGTLTLADSLLAIGDVLDFTVDFTLIFTADSGQIEEDVWTWEANPGQPNSSAVGNVYISIYQPNRIPQVTAVSTTLQEDTPQLIPYSFFLGGVTDADGDSIQSIEFVDLQGNVTWVLDDLIGDTLQLNQEYSLSANEGLYFLPEANLYGELALDWRVKDDFGNTSEIATATFDVLAVNDAPGPFQFVELGNDTLNWAGGSFSVRWTSAEDVDQDPVTYTWYLNLRDTLIQVSAGSDTAISIGNLSGTFLQDPDEYLMWVMATDGTASTQSESAIFEVVNPAITDIDEPILAEIRIYPNPVSNWLHIHVPSGNMETLVSLFSTDGKRLGNWELLQGDSVDGIHKINFGELDHVGPAILMLRLIDETGSIGAKSTLLMINK